MLYKPQFHPGCPNIHHHRSPPPSYIHALPTFPRKPFHFPLLTHTYSQSDHRPLNMPLRPIPIHLTLTPTLLPVTDTPPHLLHHDNLPPLRRHRLQMPHLLPFFPGDILVPHTPQVTR